MRRTNEVLVGIFVTVAVVVGILGTMWLARRGLTKSYALYTFFPWGENLKQGQPVLLAGVQVGYVDNVQLDPAGYLDVKLAINQGQRIPSSSKATVTAVGFFGDKAVSLRPCLPKGPATPLADTALRVARPPRAPTGGACPPLNSYYDAGDTVPTGVGSPSMDELLTRVDSMSIALGAITQEVRTQLVADGGLKDLRQTVAQTNKLVAELNVIAAQQSRNLTALITSLRGSLSALDSASLDSVVQGMQASSRNLAALTSNLQTTSARLDTVMQKVNTGDGTASRILNDPGVYLELRSSLAQLDSLLADIKANPKKYINVRVF